MTMRQGRLKLRQSGTGSGRHARLARREYANRGDAHVRAAAIAPSNARLLPRYALLQARTRLETGIAWSARVLRADQPLHKPSPERRLQVRSGERARGFQECFTHRQRHLRIIGHERGVSLKCGWTSWRELLQNLLEA